ncbi:LOW QUALITY PROTEIN: hypothetical protein U9M48_018867 [Paspalum notatum var. saurae]|uniref:Reverse transcriptase domain-containing protein n=1 Tax=Paspalum notatum var. saurae TaxID=547442 RepID=A0AAQ3WQW1_PASNO
MTFILEIYLCSASILRYIYWLPKSQEAIKIEQYRIIFFQNVSFKIFTKVATNRINKVARKVIRPSQTAFLPGRFILEGATVLHETVHEMHRKKLSGDIFKVDVQQTLRMKRFSPLWCQWVQHFLPRGSVAVKVNSKIGRYFQEKKVYDKYADDTILSIQDDLVQAKTLKILLCMFEQRLGLKINFHKSELYYFGKANDRGDQYSQILGCGVDKYPFKYLGIPMNFKKLNNKDWRIPMNQAYFGKVTIIEKMQTNKMGSFMSSKGPRGLGILNLEARNACLLCKWLYKLINEDGLWQQLLRKKYFKNKTIGEKKISLWIFLLFKFTMAYKQDFERTSGKFTIKKQYPSLFNIVMKKNSLVAHVLSTNSLNISLRRALVGDKFIKWNELVARVAHVQLDGHHDKAVWSLTKHGQFTVKSFYNFLVNQIALPMNNK